MSRAPDVLVELVTFEPFELFPFELDPFDCDVDRVEADWLPFELPPLELELELEFESDESAMIVRIRLGENGVKKASVQ